MPDRHMAWTYSVGSCVLFAVAFLGAGARDRPVDHAYRAPWEPGRRLWARLRGHPPELREAVAAFGTSLHRMTVSLPVEPEAVLRHPDYLRAQVFYRRARRARPERVRELLAEGYVALGIVDVGFSAQKRRIP
ncbi:hypothetical protein [Streptomyces smaragdinus]|uniref:hypothetical protein n=1 Tax=Streptomyces smaragdinus TaxID=2585196 RepID=UPI001296ACE7|nr:hypothetical protein [Streptomyces smaragdinus]